MQTSKAGEGPHQPCTASLNVQDLHPGRRESQGCGGEVVLLYAQVQIRQPGQLGEGEQCRAGKRGQDGQLFQALQLAQAWVELAVLGQACCNLVQVHHPAAIGFTPLSSTASVCGSLFGGRFSGMDARIPSPCQPTAVTPPQGSVRGIIMILPWRLVALGEFGQ